MRRGEIRVARLNPNQGAEVGELRPVVILQADPITQAGLATVVMVPLTSQDRVGARALRVPIRARDRLLGESFAMADQPRAPWSAPAWVMAPSPPSARKNWRELERAILGVLGISLA